MKVRYLLLVALLTLGTLFAGCRSRRTVIVDDPEPAGAQVVVIDRGPPPAPRVVVVKPARPAASYVWVQGHYVHRSGDYRWVKGHWANPPRRGVTWVPGHYNRSRGGWVKGRWR